MSDKILELLDRFVEGIGDDIERQAIELQMWKDAAERLRKELKDEKDKFASKQLTVDRLTADLDAKDDIIKLQARKIENLRVELGSLRRAIGKERDAIRSKNKELARLKKKGKDFK